VRSFSRSAPGPITSEPAQGGPPEPGPPRTCCELRPHPDRLLPRPANRRAGRPLTQRPLTGTTQHSAGQLPTAADTHIGRPHPCSSIAPRASLISRSAPQSLPEPRSSVAGEGEGSREAADAATPRLASSTTSSATHASSSTPQIIGTLTTIYAPSAHPSPDCCCSPLSRRPGVVLPLAPWVVCPAWTTTTRPPPPLTLLHTTSHRVGSTCLQLPSAEARGGGGHVAAAVTSRALRGFAGASYGMPQIRPRLFEQVSQSL